MLFKAWLPAVVFSAFCSLAALGCSSDEEGGSAGSSEDGGVDSGADAGQGGSDASTENDGAADDGGAALDMWTAWQRIQSALRQSPDHLPARAAALVAEGDPEKLFLFVRDQIATYPPTRDSFDSALSATRWGIKGTLRGGAGTPREKAELLVDLYAQAGLDAEVVSGEPDPARLTGQEVLLRLIEPAHAPAFTPTEAAAWAAALGHTMLRQHVPIDPDGAKTQALADELAAALPEMLTSSFDFTLPRIPLVRVRVDGAWQYANPIAPQAAFGESVTLAEPTPTSGPDSTERIRIALSAARSDDPYTRFELLARTFQAEEVIGRRIQLAFPPPVSTETLMQMRVKDMEMVVPVLSVVGPDMTDEERQALAVVGDMFSLGGDVYEQDPSGGLLVNGDAVAEGTTDPATIARVESVNIRANGSTYPRIRVTVSALDASGRSVSGLSAGALEVLEDGEPVSFSLTRNQAPPPRVVLLYDCSSSIPPEFLGTGAVDLGNRIVDALYASYPDASMRVATINFGASWMSTSWATNVGDARTQVAGLEAATGNSDLWSALHEVAAEQPTVILMVTDGDETDTREPELEQSVATGAPVLSVAVGTVKQATLDAISTLSGGKSVPVSQVSEATSAAVAEIDARAVEDYELSYRAPAGTATEREVSVTINGHSDSATYEVPADPIVPNALSGLYLTIDVAGREHTAAVAGFGSGFSTAHPEITSEMLQDVRSLLLGRISIQVEAAAPSASIVLDEWIGEKLAFRPIFEAAAAEDMTALLESLESGFSRAPAKLPIAQPPLEGARSMDALTFETAPRVAAMIEKVSLDGPTRRRLDLFPLSQWATAGAGTPREAWEQTLRRTARLAVMEAEMFAGTSTLEALDGQSLTLLEPRQVSAQPGLTPEQRLVWSGLTGDFGPEYSLLTPLAPGAFWAIHEPTGTVIGVLPDGTGGGAESVCDTFDQANNMLQLASLMGNLTGVKVGGWVALAQWEVKYLTMATLVIGYGAPASGITNPAVDMACGMVNDALGGVGRLGSGYGLYDAAAGTYNAVNPDSAQAPTLCGAAAGDYNPCH